MSFLNKKSNKNNNSSNSFGRRQNVFYLKAIE